MRTAGPNIPLRLHVVYASALITCAIYYVIHDYATAVSLCNSIWRFVGQATANEGCFVA